MKRKPQIVSQSSRLFIWAVFVVLVLGGMQARCESLHEAVKADNLLKVTQLIKRNPDLVFAKDEDGFTPLHLAAVNGYKDMVEFLLAAKADVNAKDNAGSTPLHQAAATEIQHRDVMEVLLAHKADVNAADRQGLTPLHYATLADNLGLVGLLLNHGANVNARDNKVGDTPLILAAAKGLKKIVELLLAQGADVNISDDRGTPMAWAIRRGHADIAELIHQHGGHQ